jgi:spore maturation protein CgeB
MRILLFYHSLVSDWNHGNAHFLRGIASELLARGHDVEVYEPRDSWSRINLIAREGPGADEAVFEVYPQLKAVSHRYDRDSIDLDRLLDGADLVLVHEWNDPSLVAAIGRRRRTGGFKLLFHDTHHRSVSDPAAIGDYDLRDYDGVLAFGALIRDLYRDKGWAPRGMDLARGGRYPDLRTAPGRSCPPARDGGCGRLSIRAAGPGLDRQLGRQRARCGAADLSA